MWKNPYRILSFAYVLIIAIYAVLMVFVFKYRCQLSNFPRTLYGCILFLHLFVHLFFTNRHTAKHADIVIDGGKDVIARFKLEETKIITWATEAKPLENYKSNRSVLSSILLFVQLLIINFLFDNDSNGSAFSSPIVMIPFSLVMVFSWLIRPFWRKVWYRSSGEVLITPFDALVLGHYINWKTPSGHPQYGQVGYSLFDAAISLSIQGFTRRKKKFIEREILIPIPTGMEAEAMAVAEKIAEANGFGFEWPAYADI